MKLIKNILFHRITYLALAFGIQLVLLIGIILPEFNSKTKAKSPVSFGIKGDFACCTEYKNAVTWKLPYQSEILAAAAL